MTYLASGLLLCAVAAGLAAIVNWIVGRRYAAHTPEQRRVFAKEMPLFFIVWMTAAAFVVAASRESGWGLIFTAVAPGLLFFASMLASYLTLFGRKP